jgi:pimeloyl-ACP methyl ester carboxylesterase
VLIGGINQWISVRGNPQKHLCLFLHGGPGLAEMPLLHSFCNELENDFLVINWDQRGAGKTFSLFTPPSSMNLNQFICDGFELITYLIKRFKKEKLYLIGHSWGSVLGMFLVQKHPKLIYSYIGISQIGNWPQGENLSYQFTLEKAHELKNKRAINVLNKLGQPPFNWKKLIRQRQLLLKFGGSIYQQSNYKSLISKYIYSKEYNLIDLLKFPIGICFSLKYLWSEISKIDMLFEVPEVHVPVCFIIGRHDYQVPHECSVHYFNKLKASDKKIVWFDKSGHTPMFEEPDKFIEIIRKVLIN